MSTLSNVHTFVKFDSKTSAAASGQRLVKMLYKTQRGGKAVVDAKQSMCVSVPMMSESLSDSQLNALIPHITQMLENAQDNICKDAYEQGSISISDASLSVDACIAFLDSDSRGDRLTKEYITAWFNNSLADILYVAFADKIVTLPDHPTEVEEKRVEQVVNVYRDKFSSLAGGRTMFNVESCNKLLKVLELGDSEDAMSKRFTARIQKMLKDSSDVLEAL